MTTEQAVVMTLGIDLASDPKKTALCAIAWHSGFARVERLIVKTNDDALIAAASEASHVGIDAPFGWPDDFLKAIVSHAKHRPWPFTESWPSDGAERLRLRETDRHCYVQTGIHPLSVSSDLIGVVAFRCAGLLSRFAEIPGATIDRSGRIGLVCEVYPAAALKRWNLPRKGYKRRPDRVREIVDKLLAECRWLELEDGARLLVCRDDDALDALLCALIARANMLGMVDTPLADTVDQARQEGWIQIPYAGSLRELASPIP